jgi:D-alanyl-lipoteichoic acid acyltransferase DltB (MBOAT superfamily)
MSLVSVSFTVFVLVTLAVYQLSPARLRASVLLVASIAFYASNGLSYALLLGVLTLLSYGAALAMERRRTGGADFRLVVASISALLLVMIAFKIAGAVSAQSIAARDPAERDLALHILLPVGLSYYVFKLIGYLLDVYWEKLPAERSLARVALYACYFPQIVSGPIQRADDFFERLSETSRLDPDKASDGLRRILVGLFKKLAIADRLAPLVAAAHAKPASHSSLELLVAAYLFAIQLYMDFSGVTDIALGIGLLFGIEGPENFDLPFFARNLQEYWRRWHMSLTSWLADYLFTPLRMALRDRGQLGMSLALVINMLAIGVWHGLAWTYAAFGLFHGLALVVSVLTLKRRDAFFRRHPALSRVRAWTAPIVTFHLVVFGLVLFRAPSLASAVQYLSHLSGLAPSTVAATRFDAKLLDTTSKAVVACVALFVATEFATWGIRRGGWLQRFASLGRPPRWVFYYALILLTLSMSRLGEEQFIYAQF